MTNSHEFQGDNRLQKITIALEKHDLLMDEVASFVDTMEFDGKHANLRSNAIKGIR